MEFGEAVIECFIKFLKYFCIINLFGEKINQRIWSSTTVEELKQLLTRTEVLYIFITIFLLVSSISWIFALYCLKAYRTISYAAS